MLDTPAYGWHDPEAIAGLVRRHPWALVVSAVAGAALRAHVPLLGEEAT